MDKDKALIVYSGWMGDFLWLVPTLRALKTKFSSLTLVVSEQQEVLARSLTGGVVDRVFVDVKKQRKEQREKVKEWAQKTNIGTYIDVVGKWKTSAFIPSKLFGTSVYIPRKADTREYALARILHPLARHLPQRGEEQHLVDAYLEIAKMFGAEPRVCFDLGYDNRTTAQADEIIEKHDLREQDSVVINLGSAQTSKIWSPQNYRRLADILQHDLKLKVVVMGAQDFKWNDDYDLKAFNSFFKDYEGHVLIHDTSLMVDACLLSLGVINVAIGNDSLAGHMAGYAKEVPADTPGARKANGKYYLANYTVSLVAPTNEKFCGVYDPTREFNLVVKPIEYPSNCTTGSCDYNQTDHVCPNYGLEHLVSPCMEKITVDQVVGATEIQLKKSKI